MPTYDYVCAACGHAFEHFQSMSSRRLRTCPVCHERKLERLVGTGAGVIFKGSGFYETDYKRSSSSPSGSRSKSGSSDRGRKGGEDGGSSKGEGSSDASSSKGGSSGSSSDGA
jgi:putative FmdB family regulatory protein